MSKGLLNESRSHAKCPLAKMLKNQQKAEHGKRPGTQLGQKVVQVPFRDRLCPGLDDLCTHVG